MVPYQKGKQWEITYRCPGYSKLIHERFPSYEAAKLRCAEIEHEKSIGHLRPPKVKLKEDNNVQKKFITVGELLDEYVQLYGLRHWGDSYLSYSRHRIEHYIKPYIGDVLLCDLTAHSLDHFYDALQDKPAVILKGHKEKGRTISLHVIEKIHTLLKSALNQAVTWGYIQTNPAANLTPPKVRSKPRKVWTPEQAQAALSLCNDPALHLAILLALGCSLRIGEILGLTWDCVDITDESLVNGVAGLYVNKELKRCDKSSLDDLTRRGRSAVLFTFPEEKQDGTKTSLVLKEPKTESSVRTVFFSETVCNALRQMKARQDIRKELLEKEYQDYNLVLAHDNGRPFEERQIADKLRRFIREHDFPPVVFHSLRHCSTSVKLQISCGNIKAVQGDTGHAQARMVTDLYAHMNTGDRRRLAQKMEKDFFQSCGQMDKEEKMAQDETAQAVRLLQENPGMAKLLLAAMGGSSG